MKTRKILNTIGAMAIGWLAGYTVTSWLFNSLDDSFRNHRAIAGTTGAVVAVVLVVSKELLDLREHLRMQGRTKRGMNTDEV